MQQPTAPSEANLAVAREIIDLGFPVETREDMFFASMDQIVIQMREATLDAYGIDDQGAIAILDEWTADYIAESKEVLRSHIPSLMEGMAASYAVIFTREELNDIRAFVATPSGQRFFRMSPAIIGETNFAAANQAYLNDVQAGQPIAMQDLLGRLQRYEAEKNAASAETSS
jgi:hypothetical protein